MMYPKVTIMMILIIVVSVKLSKTQTKMQKLCKNGNSVIFSSEMFAYKPIHEFLNIF